MNTTKKSNYQIIVPIVILSLAIIIGVILILSKVNTSRTELIESYNSADGRSPGSSGAPSFGSSDKTITNPDYLASPEKFLVDQKGEFASAMIDNQAVWVEEIINLNTIRISASVEVLGKKILTFKEVKLANINNFKDIKTCFSSEAERDAIAALEKFIKHKTIFLEIPKDSFIDCYTNDKYVILEDKYIDLNQYDTDRSYVGKNLINLNFFLVKNGFAISPPSLCSDIGPLFGDAQKIARLSKKGIWSFCENK